MTCSPNQNQILVFALYELRLLLAGHLGSHIEGEPASRAAAHLAYAPHKQALVVLKEKSFDIDQALEAIAEVDKQFGENFMQQLSEAMCCAA